MMTTHIIPEVNNPRKRKLQLLPLCRKRKLQLLPLSRLDLQPSKFEILQVPHCQRDPTGDHRSTRTTPQIRNLVLTRRSSGEKLGGAGQKLELSLAAQGAKAGAFAYDTRPRPRESRLAIRLTEQTSWRVSLRSRNPKAPRTSTTTTTIPKFRNLG